MNNQTDKELLILAAKAAGLVGYEYAEATAFTHASMQRRNIGGPEDGFFELQADVWSPLTDDGDALRLAVNLSMSIQHLDLSIKITPYLNGMCCGITTIEVCGSRQLATRRAITRAAAAIGEAL